jgi:flagellin
MLGALRSMQSSSKDISAATSRLASGLKVGKASDGASAYQGAAVMKGEQSTLNAVALSLSHAQSVSDMAIAAGEEVSKLLTTMRDTAAQAMSSDLSAAQRQTLNATFDTQKQQLTQFIKSASFDDANLLDGSRLGGVTFIADADAAQVLTLSGRNFNLDGTVVTLASAQAIDTAPGAQQAYTMLTDSITNVGGQLAQMSGESKRVQAQIGFVSKLADALAGGVGRLVDTDLAAESALIQALQVKQQLSAHALGIVNDAPQALLALFRPA